MPTRDPFGRPIPDQPKPVEPTIEVGTETKPTGSLMVFILGKPYSLMVMPVRDDQEAKCQYRLTAIGGKSYVVTVDMDGHEHCTCPSQIYQKEGKDPNGCKHISCLRACCLLNMTWSKTRCQPRQPRPSTATG